MFRSSSSAAAAAAGLLVLRRTSSQSAHMPALVGVSSVGGRRTYAASSFERTLGPVLAAELAKIRAEGTYKRERLILSPQSMSIKVSGSSKPALNFCANNYLGLADSAELIGAAKAALSSHGLGLASVRFICGTQDIHKQLEAAIAKFHGTEDTILYGSCFDANGGVFEALLGPEDVILSDALNHASIIDGTRLASKAKGVKTTPYKHLDMADLEEKLRDSQSARIRMIVTDGAFSMDGDIAPLHAICHLADKYNAILMVDECHATGFLGKTGRGTPEHCGVEGRIDIINSTLGKALGGSTGGYTTGRREIIEMLRQRSRPYLFSNSVAPPIVGASLRMFEMLQTSTKLRDQLERNTTQFRTSMAAAGFNISGDPAHPIAPVMIGDARMASEMADALLAEGVYVIGFSYPVVPKDKARIRVQLSAVHTEEHIRFAVDAFIRVGKKLGLIQ